MNKVDQHILANPPAIEGFDHVTLFAKWLGDCSMDSYAFHLFLFRSVLTMNTGMKMQGSVNLVLNA